MDRWLSRAFIILRYKVHSSKVAGVGGYNTNLFWINSFLHFRGVGSRDTVHFDIVVLFGKEV